jgi:hypothetical protein
MKEVPPNRTGEWTHDWNMDASLPVPCDVFDQDGRDYDSVLRCNVVTGKILYGAYDIILGEDVDLLTYVKPPIRVIAK